MRNYIKLLTRGTYQRVNGKQVETIKTNLNVDLFVLGDGGNDVSMIQAADAGIGIVGKVSSVM